MAEKKPLVKNAADKEQVKAAKEKEKDKRELELEDVRFILSTPTGRRFYYRHISECGVFTSSMTGNSWTYFKEGERNIGCKLLTDLNEAAPDAYALMMKENRK